MSQRSFIQSQVLEMDRLLALTGDDPLMSPGLRSRKEELERELERLPAVAKEPRTVLFFTGGPVLGSRGIDAEFASKTLGPFLEMVKTQYATSKHGNVGQRGPRQDEAEARLLLTGLPRGSFGLELSQPDPVDLFSAQHLSEVLVQLTHLVRSTSEGDEEFAVSLGDVSPRLLPRLKDFLQVLADHRANLRLVSADLQVELSNEQVREALERVDTARPQVENIEVKGTFRGVTLDTGRFDHRDEAGNTISGRIGEEVGDEDIEKMVRLTNKRSVATLRKTTITTRGGGQTRARYELLRLGSLAKTKSLRNQIRAASTRKKRPGE